MERIKKNVAGIVDHFKDKTADLEMLDTSGVVLRFTKDVGFSTIEWICHLIQKPVSSGGGGIQVVKYETAEASETTANCPPTFILSAPLPQLFDAAEKHSLLKKSHDGHMKPFVYDDRYDFENYEPDNEEFFTCAERQFLVKNLLDHVVCEDENIKSVVGYEKIKVFKGRPVLPRCVDRKIIQIYPLHDYDKLKPLKKKWYTTMSNWVQPIESIKSYFGESIALYFYFLDFYTKYLIPPAVVGVCHSLFFIDTEKADNVWFAVLNLVWATMFLELWKRRSFYLVFQWGTLKSFKGTSNLLEKPRAGYKGQPRISPITGYLEPYYPAWRRRLKMYLLTYPALITSLMLAITAMAIYLEFQRNVTTRLKDSTGIVAMFLRRVPNILYAFAIYFVNGIYGSIAVKLNDWENHRIQSSYDNHLITKLALFYFINSFMSSFYIAFYLRDMNMLRRHLATLLITQQLIQQIRESLTPYVQYKKRNIKVEKDGKKLHVKGLKDPKNQVVREGNQATYDGTFQDYLEMVLQFGYVFMFSAAYPLAAFWALLNNITELKTDAFKLCRLHQRPFIETASSIGAWQGVFEFMSILAVITNCALIALSPPIQQWLNADTHPVTYVLIFVLVEHVLIILKVAIQKAIPDVPGPILKELAKREFKIEHEINSKKRSRIITADL